MNKNQLNHLTGMRSYLGVFPVIFFHIYPESIPGGFLGVDIFFVISGFLIVKILSEQNLSFFEFYQRRLRRIAPLVILVLFLSSIIALIIFLPSDLRIFFRNLTAASLFLSNWSYFFTTGYMAQLLDFDPIVHTWSLGIEIFFYLTFPFFIFFLKNTKLKIKIILIIFIFITSYFIYYFFSYRNDPSIFFSYQGRYWEFMLGVLAYFLKEKINFNKNNLFLFYDILIIISISIIFYNFIYTDRYGNLATNSLIVCFLSALIIICGDRVILIGKLISSKIVVYLGTISFGMYLWHKPLIAYLLHYLDKSSLSFTEAFYIVLSTIILSILSYHFYENPIRKRNILKYKSFFIFIFFSITFLFSLGFYGWKSNGLPDRFDQRVVELDNQWKDVSILPTLKCSQENIKLMISECLRGSISNDIKPSFVLLGDSHAASLINAFDEIAIRNNFNYINLSFPGCGLGYVISNIKNNCTNHLNLIEELAKQNYFKKIPLVIFTLRHRDQLLNDKNVIVEKLNLYPHLTFLDFLSKNTNKMIIIEPIPAWKFNIPKKIAKKVKYLNSNEYFEITQDEKKFKKSLKNIMDKYEKLSQKSSVDLFYSSKIFCGKYKINMCSANFKDGVFYMDDNHLSILGSKMLVNELVAKNFFN